MQNLENLDVFEITAKMPKGPFCQIRAQLHYYCNHNLAMAKRIFSKDGEFRWPSFY